MIRKLLYIISLVLFSQQATAIIYFKHYNTTNSLASNKVYFVFRDKDGYMWFATDKGVSQYDGEHFKTFTILDGLGDKEIFKIYQDKTGRIWLFTFNGSPCYILNGKVYNSTNDSFLKKIPAIPYINDIYEEADGSLYLGYIDGQVFKIKDHKIFTINSKSLHCGKLGSIFPAGEGLKIMFTQKLLELNKDVISKVKDEEKNLSFYDGIRLITADDNGIKVYEQGKCIWERRDPILNFYNIIRLSFDGRGNVLCCTNNGLTIFNIKTGKKITLFNNLRISCAQYDIYGNYWISTLDNGVYYLNKNLDEINRISDNIEGYNIFYTANKQLFFVHNDTVYTLTDTLAPKMLKLPVLFSSNYEPLLIDSTSFCYYDRKNVVTYRFIFKTKKTISFPVDAKEILPYNSHNLLLVGLRTIVDFDIKNGVTVIKQKTSFPDRILFPEFSGDNKVYFISGNTLYEYVANTGKLTKIDSFSNNAPVRIYLVEGQLSVLTNDQQFITYQLKSKTKIIQRKRDVILFDVFELNNRQTLFHTDKGYFLAKGHNSLTDSISKFEKFEYPFSQSDILSLHPFNNNIICNVNGHLYSFKQKLLNYELDTPRLFIKSVMIGEKMYDTDSIVLKNTYRCTVSLLLKTLHFNNGENSFQYRIVNGDAIGEWVNQKDGNISIILGKPAAYTVECRAVTENNITSPIARIEVTLHPPFYFTKTFYAIIVTFIVMMVILIIFRVNKRREKKFENEINYYQLENKALNSLITPHFVFNAINNIQGLINIGSKEMASNYLFTLSKLIRQNIENLQFNFIPIEKELDLVRNYIQLQNLRFNNKIKLEVNEGDVETNAVNIPPLLIHTFVENSIVHGFKNKTQNLLIAITLNVTVDDYLIIKIQDNGVGFTTPNGQPGKTSLGVDFARRRLERISAFYKVEFSLKINSRPLGDDHGTDVIIMMYSKLK